ncbi:MAG: crossover junction endodeoxyribonuclease RuvC [Candidatus Moraniibacteriota bacterium]|nr:MAG: crossover junction endodeoxyribonuclease RuvC [Candidatus Moranbacteria bacterium]
MRILGIDPGTATVGWGVLEVNGNTMTAIAYGHISTSPALPLSERIAEISRDLREIAKRYTPSEASVEKIFFFKNQKTVIAVSQARGAILLTLQTLGIRLSEYTPLQVKQSLTGYGRAEKKQMQIMIKSILKLSEIPKPDDVADALALALCHANSRTYQNMLKQNI